MSITQKRMAIAPHPPAVNGKLCDKQERLRFAASAPCYANANAFFVYGNERSLFDVPRLIHEYQRLDAEVPRLIHEYQKLDDEVPRLIHEYQKLDDEVLRLIHELRSLSHGFLTRLLNWNLDCELSPLPR